MALRVTLFQPAFRVPSACTYFCRSHVFTGPWSYGGGEEVWKGTRGRSRVAAPHTSSPTLLEEALRVQRAGGTPCASSLRSVASGGAAAAAAGAAAGAPQLARQ